LLLNPLSYSPKARKTGLEPVIHNV
jgi:hypothetical protein